MVPSGNLVISFGSQKHYALYNNITEDFSFNLSKWGKDNGIQGRLTEIHKYLNSFSITVFTQQVCSSKNLFVSQKDYFATIILVLVWKKSISYFHDLPVLYEEIKKENLLKKLQVQVQSAELVLQTPPSLPLLIQPPVPQTETSFSLSYQPSLPNSTQLSGPLATQPSLPLSIIVQNAPKVASKAWSDLITKNQHAEFCKFFHYDFNQIINHWIYNCKLGRKFLQNKQKELVKSQLTVFQC